jgi:hypothetical protein
VKSWKKELKSVFGNCELCKDFAVCLCKILLTVSDSQLIFLKSTSSKEKKKSQKRHNTVSSIHTWDHRLNAYLNPDWHRQDRLASVLTWTQTDTDKTGWPLFLPEPKLAQTRQAGLCSYLNPDWHRQDRLASVLTWTQTGTDKTGWPLFLLEPRLAQTRQAGLCSYLNPDWHRQDRLASVLTW